MNKMMKASFVFIILSGLLISGCAELKEGAREVNETISKTKEDIRFLEWMSSSIEVIKNDYSAIKASASRRDDDGLQQNGTLLKQHSQEALIQIEDFSPSSGLQGLRDEYRDILNNSYEFGEMVESNAHNMALDEINDSINMFNDVAEMVNSTASSPGGNSSLEYE